MPGTLYRKQSGIKLYVEPAAPAKSADTKKSSKGAPTKSPAKKAAKKK